uniref:Uncharacterized protein MANES_12G018200 n=1 Tax=Rhizophora mucronata TaxID=61149 RepID=A0A2P2J7X2_RHIMU
MSDNGVAAAGDAAAGGHNNPVIARPAEEDEDEGEEESENSSNGSYGTSVPQTPLNQEDESVFVLHRVESKEDTFVDANDDMQENTDNGSQYADDDDVTSSAAKLEKTVVDKDSIEEKEGLLRKLAELRHELKTLDGRQLPDGEEEEIVAVSSVSELIGECSQFVKAALEERLRNESVIRELQQQIEDLNVRNQIDQSVEVVADRMLASLGAVVNQGELLDYSVMGKIALVENSTSVLVEQCSWMFNEMEQLRHCLSEARVQEEFNPWSVFADARGELLELKKKEAEVVEKLNYLEDENRKLGEEVQKERAVAESENAELEKVREELEQERKRSASTKEKLSMAVNKGKALVQQRDSLKQSLAEKTNELDKCLNELQEKSSAIEAAETYKGELIKCENLVVSLQEKLSQRNAILQSFEEYFLQTSVPEELQSVDIVERLKWLVNLVASLQNSLSLKNVTFENLEETFSQSALPVELKAADLNERARWLINSVASLEETLSQRNKILDHLDEIVSQINEPLELQSVDTLEKLKWLVNERNALKGDLLAYQRLKDALPLIDLPDFDSSPDLETQILRLKDSFNQAKAKIEVLQDDITRTKEAAHVEVEHLADSLLAESQEKEFIKAELEKLACEHEDIVKKAHQSSSDKNQMVRMLLEGFGIPVDGEEGTHETHSDVATLINRCVGKIKEQISTSFDTSTANAKVFEKMQCLLYERDQELLLCQKLLEEDTLARSEVASLSNELKVVSQDLAVLKEEKDNLQQELERSEEKSALLREKLSLAVKKGKGLVSDRDNMKIIIDEKNSEIEKLKLELKKQDSKVAECDDKINQLSTALEQIPKLEADLTAMTERRDQLEQFLLESNGMLQRIINSIDHIALPVDSFFEEPLEKVNSLVGYIHECQQAKNHVEEELAKFKKETIALASKLEEAQITINSLEDALSIAESRISQLSEENKEILVAKKNLERDLQKATDEAIAQTSKFSEACASRKSLEDAFALAENNISLLVKEREDAELSRTTAGTEVEKVKEEVAIQSSKLTEAHGTIKSLEDLLSQAEAKVTLLSDQNINAQAGRTDLENELKKLRDEANSQVGKLTEAFTTIKSLEDELSKAANNIFVLEDEKRVAEQENFALHSKLKACLDELAETNGNLESRSVEFIQNSRDLQMLVKNENLLSIVSQHFEKEFESLKNMDLIIKDICNHLVDTGSEMLQKEHPVMEEYSRMFPYDLGNIIDMEMYNGEVNAADIDNVSLYLKSIVEGLQLRNKVVAENFEGFFVFIDEFIEALLRKLTTTKDTVIMIAKHVEPMKQKIKDMELHKEEQERIIATLEEDSRILLSACSNATSELQFEVKNKLLELSSVPELQKLNHQWTPGVTEFGGDDTTPPQMLDDSPNVNMAEKLSLATREVHKLIKQFEATSNVAAAALEELQNKVGEIRESSGKAIEERDQYQIKVAKLENDIDNLQNSCNELRHKMEDYHALDEKLKEKKAEISALHGNLLVKEREAEDHLMLASQLKMLFDKINRIEASFGESEEDMEPHQSFNIKKLFHIVDSITELQYQIRVLSHDKDELQSTLTTKNLEIEHLKEYSDTQTRCEQESEQIKSERAETTLALGKIIDMLGGDELFGDQNPASPSVPGLLLLLEKRIMALLSEVGNSKSQAEELGNQLFGSQKVIGELSAKIKLLEDSIQSRTSQPEIVQERSIFEAPSVPTSSEISEIEDVGSVGKNVASSVPSAAQLRTMRKGSTDHLVLSIDSESSSQLSSEETNEDKGHVFKSLNTSGLIPKQAKSLADRVDGIWVSGGRVLTSRPRARLGIIAYCLFLHLWLLGTIL